MNFRKATMDDAARLYHWRMDDVAQAASKQVGAFTFSSHLEWLQARLADGNCFLYIGTDPGRSVTVGYCRCDVVDEETVELSIGIDPAQRGRGYAGQLVATVLEDWRQPVNYTARVKIDNFISLRVFWGLGFRLAKNQPDSTMLALERAKP